MTVPREWVSFLGGVTLLLLAFAWRAPTTRFSKMAKMLLVICGCLGVATPIIGDPYRIRYIISVSIVSTVASLTTLVLRIVYR